MEKYEEEFRKDRADYRMCLSAVLIGIMAIILSVASMIMKYFN